MKRSRFALAASGFLVLAACEKPAAPPNTPSASAMNAAQAAAAGASQYSASTLPDLPLVPKPVFAPDFVDTAGSVNLFYIAEAKLAPARASNPAVKALAADLLANHTTSQAALQKAVDASGQTIDLPDGLPDAFQAKVQVLSQTSGAPFNKIYLADQVAALQAAITALDTYAQRGDSAPLKVYAAAAAKSEKTDLDRTKALQAQVK